MRDFRKRFQILLVYLVLLHRTLAGDAIGEEVEQSTPAGPDSKYPPAWVAEFKGSIDPATVAENAWEEGVERMIIEGTEQSRKEAVKLAYEASKLGKMPKRLEIKTYFLAGEVEWALHELDTLENRTVDDWTTLGAIYSHLGEYPKSIAALSRAFEMAKTANPLWRPLALAQIQEKQGDVFGLMEDTENSRKAYLSAQSYYKQIQPKKPSLKIAKPRGLESIRTKLDMLDTQQLQGSHYADGTYQNHAYGYSGDIVCFVETASGKIQGIKIQHQEKSDLDASKKLPEQILATQDWNVDVITGATVTSNAIRNCIFNSLKHAAGIH